MTSQKENFENLDEDISELSSDEDLKSANGGSLGSVLVDIAMIPTQPITNIVDACNGTAKKKIEIMDATGQTGFWDAAKWTLLPNTMAEKTSEGVEKYIEAKTAERDKLENDLAV